MERIRKGDPVALVRVTQLITGCLARTGAYEFRDAWDDVCQEVLIRLLRSVSEGAIRDPRAFVGYAGTVTRNTFVDWLRKNRPRDTEDVEAGAGGTVAEQLECRNDPDLMVDLERAIPELPREQQEALREIYLEGRSYEEAARRLGIPMGTLKRRQTEGLRDLRRRMGIAPKTRPRREKGGGSSRSCDPFGGDGPSTSQEGSVPRREE